MVMKSTVSLIFFQILFGLMIALRSSDGANILFYIGGISSHSHQYGVEPLANKLADRGHNVTILSPLSRTVDHPTVNYFCPSELAHYHKQFMIDFGIVGLQARVAERYSVKLLERPINYFEPCYVQNEIVLKSPEFKSWADGSHFDVVISDNTCNEAAYSLVYKYGAKAILYSPLSTTYHYHYELFGIPSESSWFPAWDYNYEGDMGLVDRVHNTVTTLRWYLSYTREYLPKMDRLIRDEFGSHPADAGNVSSMPSLETLIRDTQLILASQHYSDSFAKSLPPFVIPVGGMHLEEGSGKLDSELEAFIRGGSEGFMYVSFGSIITISSMPPNLLKTFFETLQSFKNMRFLWKWEGPLPDNIPSNILFKPWFSQHNVLGHPKIRGIIFQGGQVTNQHATFNAVPLIVFPVNGDQDLNAKRIRHTGNGIVLEFCGLTVSMLKKAISEILTNKKYATTARQLSELTRDRPMLPLDTAVWWTEFVLRHENLSYLKPRAFHQYWWTQRSLDVWATIFVSLLAIILALVYAIRYFYNLFSQFLPLTASVGLQLQSKKPKSS